jgi:hypothetical protein
LPKFSTGGKKAAINQLTRRNLTSQGLLIELAIFQIGKVMQHSFAFMSWRRPASILLTSCFKFNTLPSKVRAVLDKKILSQKAGDYENQGAG